MATRRRGKVGEVVETGPGFGPIRERMAELSKLRVKVGLIGAEGAAEHPGADGFTVAAVAAVHEFGHGVPERSFLRSTMVEQRARFLGLLKAVGAKVAGGAEPRALLALVGEAAKGAVQRKIVDGPFRPLHPKTIERKGSSRPLIDTGQMRQSVTYAVVPAREAKRGAR